MAPSPELGQPKAPDKTTSPTSSSATETDNTSHHDNYLKTNASNNFNIKNDSKMYNIDDNCHSMKVSTVIDATPAATTSAAPANSSSSTSNATGASSQSAANASTPSSNSLNSTNLKNWDDCNFQSLLDEAYRYRSPKDRENKSETFLQLLQTAESKEEESEYLIRTLSTGYTQGPNRHKHGGSLQDLDKTVHNEVSLDVYGNRCHQHHHNSRPKKYSSVSSRQREGGSLPSNVNVSNCNLSICEQSFLNEDSSKRRGKNERTCSGTSCASGTSGTSSTVSTGHDSFSSGQIKDDTYTNSSAHTIIDMNETFADDSQHLVAHDSLAQGIPEPMDCDEGTELSTLKKFSSRSGGKVSVSEQKHFVDETVTFSSLEHGKNIEATYLHFDENYKACKSIMGNKTDEENKQSLSTTRTSTQKHCDENGNSLNSPYNSSQSSQVKAKKKKQPQSERNMTTLNPKACAGYRGYDTVEELLRFIENTDTKKDKMKSKKKEKTREKDKDKDKEKGEKEVQHKMKKCNSLEELRSCTKFDDDEKSESQVTMRNKGKKSSTGGSSSAINDGKETLKQQNKRGERRSWGTEELTYLGENHAIEEVREKAKEKEKKEKNKLKDNVEKFEKLEKQEKIDGNRKKKDDFNFSSTSLLADTFQSESAEFHVVTKKKKTKKRQQMDESRSGKNVSIKDTGHLSSAQGHKKFQSSNFTNDRELYLNSLNTNEPRRKSTSSVPPSEKSDTSDLDSVHSLPIESTSNRHTSGSLTASVTAAANVVASATLTAAIATVNSSQIQHQSYADIARTVNSGKPFNLLTSPPMDKMDKWPSVSTNYSSSGNSNGSSASSLQHSNGNDQQISINKQKKSLNKNFSNSGNDKSNNNDSGSSSSSISSNSTIIKQISYSQSLGDEKFSSTNSTSTKSSASAAVSQQRLTDVIRLSDSKQTLQKSKSFENDNYYSNMDQYPALEKTVKRHATHSTIFDPRSSSQVSLNPLQFQSRSITVTQNLSQPTIVTGITGDVKSKGVTVNSGDVSNFTGITVPSASLLNPGNNSSGSKKSKQQHHQLVQQPQQPINAKIVYTDNPQIVPPATAIDVSNSRNRQQGLVPSPVQSGQGAIVEQTSSKTSSINVNIVKKSKSEEVYSQLQPQQQPQQQQISTLTNPQGRKNKKDKNNQNSFSVGTSDSVMTSSPMFVTNNINSNSKISNRPAVIILNDANDTSLSIANDFTFGDFNEEELRLFDNNQPIHQQQSIQLDDSGQYTFNQSVPDVNLIQTESSIRQYDDPLHLSPHSDQGYSSSNNRSILSESSESSICTKIDGEYISTQIFPTISENCNISPDDACNKRQMHNINIGPVTESTSSPLSTAPNNATNLGTNYVVASAKIDLSCNRNSINNYSEISLDPCIIAVNSVDINTAKRNLIYNVENSVQQQQQTQQLMNQILVNSGSASSTSINNKNNTNCNISNVMSGMSSNNDKLSTSLKLSHKKCANNNVSSDVTTTASTGNVVNQQTSDNKIIFDGDSANTSEDNEFTASWDSQNNKGINIRFVAPPSSREMSSVNIEKMVDFVSLAWEEILHGVNRGTQFYNGQ